MQKNIFNLAFGLVTTAAKTALKTPGRRLATGAAAGAFLASRDGDDPYQTDRNALTSALAGAGLGLGVALGGNALLRKDLWKSAWANKRAIGKHLVANPLYYGTKAALGIADFAMTHPKITTGIGLAGAAIYAGTRRDTRTQTALDTSAWSPGEGGSRNYSRREFQQSAFGVTTGLHNRRHG